MQRKVGEYFVDLTQIMRDARNAKYKRCIQLVWDSHSR